MSIKYGIKNYTVSWNYKLVFSTWREVHSLHDRKAVIFITTVNFRFQHIKKEEHFKSLKVFLLYHFTEVKKTLIDLLI